MSKPYYTDPATGEKCYTGPTCKKHGTRAQNAALTKEFDRKFAQLSEQLKMEDKAVKFFDVKPPKYKHSDVLYASVGGDDSMRSTVFTFVDTSAYGDESYEYFETESRQEILDTINARLDDRISALDKAEDKETAESIRTGVKRLNSISEIVSDDKKYDAVIAESKIINSITDHKAVSDWSLGGVAGKQLLDTARIVDGYDFSEKDKGAILYNNLVEHYNWNREIYDDPIVTREEAELSAKASWDAVKKHLKAGKK